MRHYNTIIVGGGPAGASCARGLREQGVECVVLDKQPFPQPKLCAGWITPDVLRDLQITAAEYPHTLTRLRQLHVYVAGREVTVKAEQYAIRRVEFDAWLLGRCGAPVLTHEVKRIARDGARYVLDEQYTCDYLVGAGGAACPVYRELFKSRYPRTKKRQVVTLEQELAHPVQDGDCHLWFFQRRLPGYAWYVPKGADYVNVGIGGFVEQLRKRRATIRQHWQWFVRELGRRSLVNPDVLHPGGCTYYTRGRRDAVQQERALLIGDAAGLATRDLAEGIGPAVKSGLLAADAISSGQPLSVKPVSKYSLFTGRTLLNFLLSHK
jgi:flavin-dependent dehydrogenase